MKTAVFSVGSFEIPFLRSANGDGRHELALMETRLHAATAPLADGFPAVSGFVADDFSAPVLRILAAGGTRYIALRSAGFNHVDLDAAHALGMRVARVPEYSPYAVAEHAVGLILSLNRRLHRAYARVREGNFSLGGLLGFDLHGKTVGVVGTGRIGAAFARIMLGFGCRVIAFDPLPSEELRAIGVEYRPLDALLTESDVISLHCPLTPKTQHLIDAAAIGRMKDGVMLINTSRGGLVDTKAVIDGLKSGRIGYLGIDVYEEESRLFFRDLSLEVIQDDVFSRLLTFPNVLVTGHQGFFTIEALTAIAETTMENLDMFEHGEHSNNDVASLDPH